MTTKIRLAAGCLGVGIWFLICAPRAFAQINTGQIMGTIKDSQGLVIAGVQVTIGNEQTGETFQVMTNEVGDYLACALPVGSYALTVEQSGFKRYNRTGVALTGGQLLRVDVALEVGSATDTVVVTAEVPPVNVTTSTLDTMIDDKRLVDLPMNGRNMLSLASLTPGVRRDSVVNGPSSDQQHVNVNGGRGSATNMVLDGQPMYYGHRGQTLNAPPPRFNRRGESDHQRRGSRVRAWIRGDQRGDQGWHKRVSRLVMGLLPQRFFRRSQFLYSHGAEAPLQRPYAQVAIG